MIALSTGSCSSRKETSNLEKERMEEVNKRRKKEPKPRKAFWENMRRDLDSWKDKKLLEKIDTIKRWIADAPPFHYFKCSEDIQDELVFWKELDVLSETGRKELQAIMKDKFSEVLVLRDEIFKIPDIQSMLDNDSEINLQTKIYLLEEIEIQVEEEHRFQPWFCLLDFLTQNKIDGAVDMLEKDPKIPYDAKRWIVGKIKSRHPLEIEEKSKESLAARECYKNLIDQVTSVFLEVDEINSTRKNFDQHSLVVKAIIQRLEYEEELILTESSTSELKKGSEDFLIEES